MALCTLSLRKHIKLFAILATIALLLPLSTFAQQRALRIPLACASIQPKESITNSCDLLMGSLYEGLLTVYSETQPNENNGLLKTWIWSDSNRQLDLYLHNNRYWSDGQPVTAADLKASWQDLLKEDIMSPARKGLQRIVGAELCATHTPCLSGLTIINDYHFRLNFSEPSAEFSYLFSDSMLFPIPAHFVKRNGEKWWKRTNIPFNGVYQAEKSNVSVQSRIKQGKVVLVPNPHYYDPGTARIKWVEASRHKKSKFIRASVMTEKLLDISYNTTPLQPQEIRFLGKQGWRVEKVAASSGIFTILMNPSTLDSKLMETIRYIFSPDIIASRLKSKQLTSRLYYGPQRIKPFNNQFYIKDLKRRELLVEEHLSALNISQENPVNLNLIYDLKGLKGTAEFIRAMLSKKGIFVEYHYFDSFSGEEFRRFRQNNAIHFELLSWISEDNDPEWIMDMVDVSVLPLLNKLQQIQVNALKTKADNSRDFKERIQHYHHIEEILVNQSGFLPFRRPINQLIVNNEVCFKKEIPYSVYVQDLYWCLEDSRD